MRNYHQLSEMLAEVDALQARILALKPLSKEENLHHAMRTKIELSQSGNSLEGGSLSGPEVRSILVEQLAVGGKSLKEHLELMGHARGVEHIFELSRPPLGNGPAAPERTIKRLHKLCFGGIAEQSAGSYRKRRVMGLGLNCPRPQDIPAAMAEFTAMQPEQNKKLHPLLYATWLHHRFLEISPFGEGNGVVARLLLNLALMRKKHLATPIPSDLAGEYQASLLATAGEAVVFNRLLCACHLQAQQRYLERWEAKKQES